MLTQDGERLAVFDAFQVDYELPKFCRQKNSDVGEEGGFGFGSNMFSSSPPHLFVHHPMNVSDLSVAAQVAPPIGARFGAWVYLPKEAKLSWWRRLFSRKVPKSNELPEGAITVEEFFSSVKNTAEELVVIKERAKGYEEAILNAKKAGQRALCEKLEEGLSATRAETQLVAMGMSQTLSEERAVEFYKKCRKGLRLDWICHFARTIPVGVTAQKERADAVGAFDNYLVLHYDPLGKAFAESEADKRRRKDPILFGVVKGRRRLYFVGDWVDEACDLTLDQVADLLGKEAITHIEPLALP
jgi:hypothetical protein